MRVTFEPGRQAFSDLRAPQAKPGQGRSVNLKHEPDRAAELPEAVAWPALGELVKQINQRSMFQTTGWKASGRKTDGLAHPFVDLAFADEASAHSEKAYARLRDQLLTLRENRAAPDYPLIIWDGCAVRRDTTRIRSLRLWLAGPRSEADECFRQILGLLDKQKYEDYEELAISDHNMKRLLRLVTRAVLMGWLALGSVLWSGLGFLGAVAIAWLVWFAYSRLKSRSYTILDWR